MKSFWVIIVILITGCGSEFTSTDTLVSTCDPGQTRMCVGFGACQGGQLCTEEKTWTECVCSLEADSGNETDSGYVNDVDGGFDAGADVAVSVDSGPDVNIKDSGETDSNVVMDSGTVVDSGTVDSGTVDSGTVDSGTVDSGTVDSTTDTTVDSGCSPVGTQNCPAVDCKSIFGSSGNYWVQPDKTYTPFRVYCDMSYNGGGWALIYSTDGSQFKCTTETDFVSVSSHTYLTELLMVSLAKNSNQVHIRKTGSPFESITSTPNSTPIFNLRNSDVVSAGNGWSHLFWGSSSFQGDILKNMLNSSGDVAKWPNVYWAGGNTKGLHIVSNAGGTDCISRWSFQGYDIAMQVYIR